MKVLTEAELRAKQIDGKTSKEFVVADDVFVTELAKEYLRDRGIRIVTPAQAAASSSKGDTVEYARMTRTPIRKNGGSTYISLKTGEGFSEKPEDMTHLRGNLLVPKTHPRIEFRGKLDSLQAEILLIAAECGEEKLCEDLDSVLNTVQQVLGAEVRDEKLPEQKLLGLTHKELREISHNVKKHFGIDHPIPNRKMGTTALKLNRLRTQVREAELAAARAFEGEGDPLGIIEEMNRLSSGIYILFCRVITGHYRKN